MDAEKWMTVALGEAREAFARGEVPVGAVLVDGDGREIARAGNRTREMKDATAHAEILALRAAELREGDFRLDHIGPVTCVVTIEPCLMCLGALSLARISRIVFGIRDEKFGGLFGKFNLIERSPFSEWEITEGVLADECHELLKKFFENLRNGTAPG
ncbi:nucleoside deaminase [bacterium]|nr:nucleoside deaminase [bacterium]